MAGVIVSLALAFALTCLVALVEVTAKAKAGFRAAFNGATLVYLALLAAGNLVATFVAYHSADLFAFPVEQVQLRTLLSAAAGVMAFQLVLSHANITLFEKGVLTFDTWLSKARLRAAAVTIERQAHIRQAALFRNAHRLKSRPEAELNAYLKTHLQRSVAELEREAERSSADPHFYKALVLATELEDHGAAVLHGVIDRRLLWRWVGVSAGAVFVVLLAALVVWRPWRRGETVSDEGGETSPVRQASPFDHHPITFRAAGAEVQQVFRHCADTIGAQLVMTGSLGFPPIDLDLNGTPLSEVMDDLCTMAGCRWQVQEGPPRVLVVEALTPTS